jgi:Enoyl-CoA hydratase/carnithine racemase
MNRGIRVERSGSVATVVIDNPRSRNSLDRDLCLELTRLMPELDRRSDVTVIALRGAGDDFCSGAALDSLDDVLFDGRRDEWAGIDRLSEADAAISSVRKPTVALVRGVCMGGGWQIAAACDLVLAADDARLAITPSKVGIIYPRVGLDRLVRRVGEDRARYLLFTAAEIPVERALSWGLVTDLLPADVFEEQAQGILETISARSQYSIVTMKSLLAAAGPEADAAWEREWAAFPRNPDLEAGRRAFCAKQAPAFPWTADAAAL